MKTQENPRKKPIKNKEKSRKRRRRKNNQGKPRGTEEILNKKIKKIKKYIYINIFLEKNNENQETTGKLRGKISSTTNHPIDLVISSIQKQNNAY